MDAQTFLAEFGHIVNAPGGIAQLRQMIYQLAVTGFLTPRGDRTEDAGQLLSRIEQERRRLIRAKRYKRMPKLESEPIRPPQGIKLPESWRWSRLLDIGEINPRNEAPDDLLAAFVPMSGVPQLHKAPIVAEIKRWGEINKGYTHFANGDVVLAKITPCFENGKAAVVENLPDGTGIGSGTTELQVVRPIYAGVLPGYLYLFLRSPLFTVDGEKSMTGTAGQKRVPTDYFSTRAFPLPPTEEQALIVAKVDELMALCDRLEEQHKERQKLQRALRQATLQAVTDAQSLREFQSAWTRMADIMWMICRKPEDVADLRKSILDLTVSGHFSSFDKSDQPATSLKEKIIAAKNRGVLAGTMVGKRHVKPEVLQETVLPPHWETITLDEAISTIDAGWSPACLPNARKDAAKWGILKTTSVQILKFLPHEHKELPVSLEPRPQYQIEVGDILITRAGPKNRVGICCVVDAAPARLMISDKIIRFHIVDDLINPHFVALCLSAGEPGRMVERLKSGMAESQMNISQDKLRSITIPLPPQEEQRRILRKIDTLMQIIDTLESKMIKSLKVAEQLATASISSIAGIARDQEQDDSMKAPEAELVALLRLGATPNIKEQAPLATILARHHGEMSAKDLWQRFGGEIDVFYAQLKTEVANGWIREPAIAEMREVPKPEASA